MEELFYTTEEKYLCASNEAYYGNHAKAKIMAEQILEEEPEYARAHFLLGCVYYNELFDFNKARKHFELALLFEPQFILTYDKYLGMLVHLNRKEEAKKLAEKGLAVLGVCASCIHNKLGLVHEKTEDLNEAIRLYKKAIQASSDCCNESEFSNNLERTLRKQQSLKAFKYVS